MQKVDIILHMRSPAGLISIPLLCRSSSYCWPASSAAASAPTSPDAASSPSTAALTPSGAAAPASGCFQLLSLVNITAARPQALRQPAQAAPAPVAQPEQEGDPLVHHLLPQRELDGTKAQHRERHFTFSEGTR